MGLACVQVPDAERHAALVVVRKPMLYVVYDVFPTVFEGGFVFFMNPFNFVILLPPSFPVRV